MGYQLYMGIDSVVAEIALGFEAICRKRLLPSLSLPLSLPLPLPPTRMLRNNRINCIHNDSFTGLRNVRLLSLYDNQISTIAPGAFDTLQSLSTLWVMRQRNSCQNWCVHFRFVYSPLLVLISYLFKIKYPLCFQPEAVVLDAEKIVLITFICLDCEMNLVLSVIPWDGTMAIIIAYKPCNVTYFTHIISMILTMSL